MIALDLAIFGGRGDPPLPAMSVLIYISKFTYFRHNEHVYNSLTG